MSMEKLQKLTDLDAELKELEEQRAIVLGKMHAIIGDGFVVAGARVVPIKRGKNALPKAEESRVLAAVVEERDKAQEQKLEPSEGQKQNASIAARVLSCLTGGGTNGLTAITVAERIGVTVTQAASAITYLSQTGRIVKTAPGTYRSK